MPFVGDLNNWMDVEPTAFLFIYNFLSLMEAAKVTIRSKKKKSEIACIYAICCTQM